MVHILDLLLVGLRRFACILTYQTYGIVNTFCINHATYMLIFLLYCLPFPALSSNGVFGLWFPFLQYNTVHSAVVAAPMIASTIANQATIIHINCSWNVGSTLNDVDGLCVQKHTHTIRAMHNAYVCIQYVLYTLAKCNEIIWKAKKNSLKPCIWTYPKTVLVIDVSGKESDVQLESKRMVIKCRRKEWFKH